MREGKGHPRGPAAALPAPGGCRRWAAPLGRARGIAPELGAAVSDLQRAGGAGAKSKAHGGPGKVARGPAASPLSSSIPLVLLGILLCPQGGTSSGNIFIRHCLVGFFNTHCSLSGASLLSPLVPQVFVGCSLHPLWVYLLSVVDLSLPLLHAVTLCPHPPAQTRSR